MFGKSKKVKNKGIDDIFVEIEVAEEKPKVIPTRVKDDAWEDLKKRATMASQQYTQAQMLRAGISVHDAYTQALGDMNSLKAQYIEPTDGLWWYDKYKDAEIEAKASTNSLGLYTKNNTVEKVTNYVQQDAMATYNFYERLREETEYDHERVVQGLHRSL